MERNGFFLFLMCNEACLFHFGYEKVFIRNNGRSDMLKQANLKNNFLKPNRSKEKDDETEMQSEITATAAGDVVALAEKKQKYRAFRPEWKDKYPC